jgi:hypothetical protein
MCACLLTVAFVGCDVDVKDEGALPKVDVEGGRMPDVDATGPDVDVKSKKETVTVPDVDVDVGTEEKEVTVPDIDVDIPDENDQ